MQTRRTVSIVVVFAATILSFFASLPGSQKRESRPVPRKLLSANTNSARLLARTIAHLPLSFEENRGQLNPAVKFLSRGASYGLYLSNNDAIITHQAKVHLDGAEVTSALTTFGLSDTLVSSTTKLSWLGSNPHAQPRGLNRQPGVSNYLLGKDPRKWQRHVSHYDRVQLRDLYPGIDLTYYGNQQRVEFDYVVAPHADPKSIQVGISGPSIVSLDDAGRLSISSAGDEMLLLPPVAFQEKNGKRSTVTAHYVLLDSHRLGFEIGPYDQSQPLIIDPVLDFATSFGPNDNQSILSDVVLDSTGNIYVTGMTCDTNYPTTAGVFQPNGGSNTANICGDVVVTKLDPTGSTLLYSTYIGSQSGLEFGARLLVDTAGEVTLGGATNSSDFPTTAGAFQESLPTTNCVYNPLGGSYPCAHGFLLKLSADGSNLVYSTLLGGERFDAILSIAQDSNSDTFVTGGTNSIHFPTAGTPYSTTYGGGTCEQGHSPCSDVFVAELSPDGSHLLASTYIPGNDDDFAGAIAIDTTGNVYVAGTTFSTNYPHTAGVVQPAHAGTTEQADVFVTKLPPSLSSLTYSTYIGGTNDDFAVALRVDSTGAAYVTGSTDSPDFPVTAGAYQATYKGPAPAMAYCPSSLDSSLIDGSVNCGDAFLAKLNPTATALTFATFLGGSGSDFAYNLAIDSTKNVWLFGNTASTDFPYTPDAYFTTPGSGLFLSEIKSDGSALLFSTPLSQQSSQGLALGIAIDPTDDVVVAGQGTVSSTPGSYNFNSGGEIFVMKFSPGTARPGVLLSATSLSFTPPAYLTAVNSSSAPQTVTLTNNGTGTLHLAISVPPASPGTTPAPISESDNCGSSVAPSAMCTIRVIYQPTVAGSNQGADIKILSDAPDSPQIISVYGNSGVIESASFTPPVLNFPGQAPGAASASQMSFLNGSATDVNSFFVQPTAAPVVGGANASDFQIDLSNCTVGSSGCYFTVSFKPTSASPVNRTATISVATQAANSPEVLTLNGTVSTGPVISAFPVALTPTVVGQTLNGTLTITNTGGSALNVSAVVVSGANASDFVIQSNINCGAFPFTLASQGACSLNVAFKPSAPGNRTATLTFTDNEAAPTSIPVTGNAANAGGPEFSLSLTPSLTNGQFYFPDTVVGHTATYNVSTVSLLNLASPGASSGAHITATLTGDFTQTNNCPVPPAQLTGGQNCTYTVLFAPTAAGSRTGTLAITTDAPGTPTFTVNYVGNGVTIPAPTLAPPLLNFGPIVTAATSASQNLSLVNTGNGPLTFTTPVLTGPFSLSATTCTSPLAPAGSCTFSVKFTPPAKGPASGTLTLTTNAASQALAAGLQGSGVNGPVAIASPTALTFGNQPINSTSPPQPVILTNAGDTTFNIAGVHASENFSETNNCGASLAPAATCTINVSFAPGNDTYPTFTTNGQVFITTNAPGSPLAIPLTGTPTASTGAATVILISTSPNPSTVGQSVTFTATITSQTAGTITGTVTFYDNGTQVGTGALTNGTATFSTTSLTAGTHSITASYPGDSNFAPSHSSGASQIVNGTGSSASTTTLTSAPNPSTVGQSVTFTANVASQSTGTISGTVNFLDGSVQIGTGAITAGVATFATTSLAAGTHSIAAQYTGNATFAASTSIAVSQVVNAASTGDFSIAVAPSTVTVSAGQTGASTITVAPLQGFASTVTLACGALPAKVTCGISPTSVTLDGTDSKTAAVMIGTVANAALPPTSSSPKSPRHPFGLFSSVLLALLLLFLARRSNSPLPQRALLAAAMLVLAFGLGSCNGGAGGSAGSNGTVPGTYPITLTGTGPSGSAAHSTTLTLTVTK
jgi:hypothetical protein